MPKTIPTFKATYSGSWRPYNKWANCFLNSHSASDLINVLFYPRDIQKIKEIPIHTINNEDHLIWSNNRDGHYLVKSAYYTTTKTLVDNSNLCVPREWHSIWNLNILHKLKNFTWRLLQDCLPTRQSLIDRVQCQGLWPLSETNLESA